MFTQVLEFVNKYEFNKCVKRYTGDYHIHEPNCWNHFIQLLFGQMTSLESLRSICLCLKARVKISFSTLAFKQYVNHITLSRANEQRDWRIFADFGNYLILLVCPLYADSPCTALISIRCYSVLCERHLRDGQGLCRFRGLVLYIRINTAGAFFVTRTKFTLRYSVVEQNFNIDQTTGLRTDRIIELTVPKDKAKSNSQKTLGTFFKCCQDTLVDGNLYSSDCCIYQTLDKKFTFNL